MNTARMENAPAPQGLGMSDIQRIIGVIGEIGDRVGGVLPQQLPCSMVGETPKTAHPKGWEGHRGVTVERQ